MCRMTPGTQVRIMRSSTSCALPSPILVALLRRHFVTVHRQVPHTVYDRYRIRNAGKKNYFFKFRHKKQYQRYLNQSWLSSMREITPPQWCHNIVTSRIVQGHCVNAQCYQFSNERYFAKRIHSEILPLVCSVTGNYVSGLRRMISVQLATILREKKKFGWHGHMPCVTCHVCMNVAWNESSVVASKIQFHARSC